MTKKVIQPCLVLPSGASLFASRLKKALCIGLMTDFLGFHLLSRFSKPPFSPLVVNDGFV